MFYPPLGKDLFRGPLNGWFANLGFNSQSAFDLRSPRLSKALAQNLELAEEAVISELVSARLFPVRRENTGKTCHFRFEIAKAPRLSEEVQSLSNKIP
jgi:hypothetical protein